MKYAQIAHYGGYLLVSLNKYSRRQLKHGHALRKQVGAGDSLLKRQAFKSYLASEWLICFEQRHVDSWTRLIEASRISRRRAARMGAVA